MVHIQRKEFTRRGNFYGLVSMDEGVPEMVEFSWVDCYKRYFVVTRISLEEG